MKKYPTRLLVLALSVGLGALNLAAQGHECFKLPGFAALQSALASATAAETSGLNNQMWATIVDRDGVVCAVAFSGVNRGAQSPGSRVISAQKANTANAFRRLRPSQRPRAFYREPVFGRAAGRQPLRSSGE